MMTVSAVSRLIPSPPARVESRKAKSGEPGALKCSIDFFRMSDATVPGDGNHKRQLGQQDEVEQNTHHPGVDECNLGYSCSPT